jgi:Skp family chaperone for outer membrane proteins
VEYQAIIAAVEREVQDEERDIEARQAEVDTTQALLDRRRRALKRKRAGFERLLSGWNTLDAEVVSGKPSAAEDTGETREPGGDEDEAAA